MSLLALLACASRSPNLLVVVLDNVRYDHTSLAGGRDTTPNLAALAARGTTFDAAFSAAAENELAPMGWTVAADGGTRIPNYASETFAGSETGGRPSLFETVPPALAWIDDHRGVPWLAVVHGGDALLPWSQRGPFYHLYGASGASARTEQIVGSATLLALLRGPERVVALTAQEARHISDHYDSALTYGDLWLGVLLAEVDLDRTVVVVVGNRGEDLLDHPEEAAAIADSTMHVPLVVAGPGFARAGHRADSVSTQDVLPTLLFLADPAAPARADVPGLSLLCTSPRDITGSTRVGGRWRRKATGEWTMVEE